MARPRSRIPESSSSIRDSQNQSEEDECRLDIMRKGRSTWWPPHPIRAWLKLINLPDLGSSIKDPMVDQAKSPKPCSRIAKVVGLLCFALIVLVTSLGSWPQRPSQRGGVGGVGPNIYSGYRRLREQVIADFSDIGGLLNRGKELGLCGRDREDFIPCYNVTRENNNDRHCGYSSRIGNKCLVRPPKDYKIPLRWPTGRDVIWSNNVKITKDQLLSSGSLTKRLMLLEDNQISFRSEDALVIDGVEDYSHQIAEMIGLRNESEFIEAGVRIVLDIDCGFGSFGAHLLSKNLLTMCIAPYEISGSQVQLALERGLPAMLGSFNSKQLPYPALSFDMVHCAKCSIDWEKKDGSYLIEVDRVLKPGGYFVWTSPLMDFHGAMLKKENQNKWNFVQEFVQKLCWVLMSQQEETVLWQKTANKECYTSRKLRREPPLCQKGQDSESPYYQPLLPCISGVQNRRWIPIQNQTKWPARMLPNSDSLAIHGIHAEELSEDNKAWSSMIKDYWSLLTPLLFSDHPKRPGEEDPLPPFNMLRNVMDMNAQYGGLNAALLEAGKTVWVMNVVPTSGSNTLPLILDRGFIGVLHDWCEAFPTYPRTYDMLHAAGLLSQEMNHQYKCGLLDLFLEMDRILRPEGWVVLRDEVQKIEEARSITTQLRWDARIVEIEDDNEQRLLVCQKPFVRK